MASIYTMSIKQLNGIGPKRAELFSKLGIKTVGELLYFFPRAYEDFSTVDNISDLEYGGSYCIKATVGVPITDTRISGGRLMSKTTAYDETGTIQIVFFNNKYVSTALHPGHEYYFYGKTTATIGGIQMISPTFSDVGDDTKIHPIYRQTQGLVSRTITNCVNQALKLMPKEINDTIPENIRNLFDLMDLRSAIFEVHFPKNMQSLQKARKRFIIEELLLLNLGMRTLKSNSRGITAVKVHNDYTEEFIGFLPFTPTNAQLKTIKDCMNDVCKNVSPMNRLVQGDVGCGKTVVAACVCYNIIKNGYQAAFMVPTDILARQHFATFQKLFVNTEIKVGLLTGSLKDSEKKAIREKLKSGELNFVVGTHALITDKTEFNNLGLAVTDEQHRFGVAQRAKLLTKGENPHLLVMSATPIPRTLGLIIYGDLDISIIDELPPQRKPVKTMLIDILKRKRTFDFIRQEISQGRQAYIVCPLVEEKETSANGLASAEEYAAELMLNEFSDIPVGILHGQMKSSEKEEIMNKFANNEFSILVSTTVIEVGVDVPNASIIMIENAERFGLSQLHQLRGRVGRGKNQSYCILVSATNNKDTLKRLEIMCHTTDGFKIADEDLKLRGPGDFFGERQHGLPTLSIADFADTKSLELTKNIADYIMFTYKDIRCDELRYLRAEIKRLFNSNGVNTLN